MAPIQEGTKRSVHVPSRSPLKCDCPFAYRCRCRTGSRPVSCTSNIAPTPLHSKNRLHDAKTIIPRPRPASDHCTVRKGEWRNSRQTRELPAHAIVSPASCPLGYMRGQGPHARGVWFSAGGTPATTMHARMAKAEFKSVDSSCDARRRGHCHEAGVWATTLREEMARITCRGTALPGRARWRRWRPLRPARACHGAGCLAGSLPRFHCWPRVRHDLPSHRGKRQQKDEEHQGSLRRGHGGGHMHNH